MGTRGISDLSLALALGTALASALLVAGPLALLAAPLGWLLFRATQRAREPGPADAELQVRACVEAMPGYAWAATREGMVQFVNPRILALVGMKHEEAVGGGWTQVVHPDDLARTLESWTRAVQTGETYEIERRMRGADGAYRWFHSTAEPQRDARGNAIRWYGIDIDVDERRRAQEALDASEREVRSILDGIPGFVAAASPIGENEYANRRLIDYLGVAREDLLKLGFIATYHPEDRAKALANWLHSVESGEPLDSLYRMRRYDGEYRWFRNRAEPRIDEQGRIVRWYLLFVDVDDERKAEDALRLMQGSLSRASRIATVAELSASIAHEINQPLAAVVANGHACQRWMAAEPPDLEMARQSAERIIRDGHAAAEVVERVRALFRQAPLAAVPLDLNAVIAEVCRLVLDEVRGNRVKLETDLDPALPRPLADRVQMQQLLLNLMHNGLDAMETVSDAPKSLVVRSRAQASEVLVEVRDQGVGLENAERVFEPFFTTKEGGMGMGLAICRSIVEAHEGRLWATRNEGPGSTFSFTLPRRASPP